MKTRILVVLGIATSSFCYLACSDDNAVTEPPGSGGTSSGQTSSSGNSSSGGPGTDGGKDCFDPPFTTHFQIINACTNADRIDRKPKSTKIFADGGVPKP